MSNAEPILADFLTREQLASELRRSARTLDLWEVLGVGPPRTLVGRQVLCRRSSFKWLAAQEQDGEVAPRAIDNSGFRNSRVRHE